MAWRNLRADISEMFTEYSRGEELSEYVQGLLAKRLTQHRERAEKLRAYFQGYRERNREKVRAWNRAARTRRQFLLWQQEEERWCARCREQFKRAFGSRGRYCSDTCRKEARREMGAHFTAQYHAAHKEEIRDRKKRWYEQNREKVLVRVAARKEEIAAKQRAYYQANRDKYIERAKKRAQDKEQRNAQSRAYYAKHREAIRAKRKKQREDAP